jgi:DNA (cytosine-5)-methyltransferase 1
VSPAPLVLSLFPGIGLLDIPFEELGYCVVRGPDLLWGGDIHSFHPPPGRFAGIIGGPPCQAWSRLRRLFQHNSTPAPDLIPEFARCVEDGQPQWFLMENVPEAPVPLVSGYQLHDQLLADHWVGGHTRRIRRWSFGTPDGRPLRIELHALHTTEPLPAICASGSTWVPLRHGDSGKPKTTRGRVAGIQSTTYFEQARAATGLPDNWDLPGWTVAAKIRAIGNGVPLAMGRAVARAVQEATTP